MEYGRTRSETKKKQAASGASAASPARLAGAFDDEADSAAGAAVPTRRTLRQRQPPRLTQAVDNNTNSVNAASDTGGKATSSASRAAKKPARTPSKSAKKSTAASGENIPAGTRGPYTSRQDCNFPGGITMAYAAWDKDVYALTYNGVRIAKDGLYASMAPPPGENDKPHREAWNRLRPGMATTVAKNRDLAKQAILDDVQAKAASGEELMPDQRRVAESLGFGPLIGGAVSAGGIPAGGAGEAVAAGAAAAGGYGHGYGYASAVGIGGGIGGAGIMGHGAGAVAIGGALNIIPPSPSAGGGAAAGTPHAVGTPVQEFAQMMLEQRRDDQKQQAQQRRDDEERRMKFEAEQQERQRQFQMKMQAEQYQNQAQQQERLNAFQAQQQERQHNFEAGMQERQEERQNAFQAEQQERQNNFEAGMQERQEERQNAFQAGMQERQNNFEAGMQERQEERQNKFEAGMQDRQNAFEAKHSLILERVLDRLDEQRQVGEKLQAQQAQTDKRIGDHLARYENDKEKLGAELADVIERLTTLENGSDEKKLLNAMLDGRKLQQQGAQEQDGNEEEDAAVEMPPASSEVADGTEIGSISYDDTKPAPTEEILALAKKGLIEETFLNKQVASNLISQYAKDHGINLRLRKKKMWKKDTDFLVLSELVLKAIPPYPFSDYFVYRCIKASPEHILWFQQHLASGKPIKELAFTSACAFSPQQQLDRPELSTSFATMNTYIAIRSRSGRLVRKYVRSKSYKKEWEVLFCYGTTFRILSFEDTRPGEEHEVGTPGRYRIVMEEVKSRIPGLKKAHTDER